MKSLLSLIFVCVTLVLVSCNTEEVKPNQTTTPATNTKSRITEDGYFGISPDVDETVSVDHGKKITKNFEVTNPARTDRTYIKLTGFSGAFAKLIIKDANGNYATDVNGEDIESFSPFAVTKYAKVTGTKFSITINNTGWLLRDSEVKFMVENW